MRGRVLAILIVVEVIYLVTGGLVFWALQSSASSSSSPADDVIVNTTLLLQLIEDYFGNETCVNRSELVTLIQLASTGGDILNVTTNHTVDMVMESNWDIGGSIFFAMTVVSTIGYGNLVPTTSGSRAFCCCYALVGIPITLVMMVGIGEKLNKQAARLENRLVKKRPRLGKIARSVLILCFGMVFFLLIPAIVIAHIQDWPYGTAIYYGVITLTTVGFGDYVAGFPFSPSYAGPLSGIYRVSVGVWIYIGLSWLSGLISSIQESFNATVHRVDSDPIIDRYRTKHEQHIHKQEADLTDSRTDGRFIPLGDDDCQRDRNHVTSDCDVIVVAGVSSADIIAGGSVLTSSIKGTPV